MGYRKLAVATVLGAAATWIAVRRLMRTPRPLSWLPVGLESAIERRAIRGSGRFLRSMGAVESAPRAEQDAFLAHRVSRALAERLHQGIRELSVLIIGGVIHLEGRVRTPEDRSRAERVAREVSGAQIIADDLDVNGR